MKIEIIKLVLLALLTSTTVLAQNESTQFEKTHSEIINLINLPNPTFNPNIVPAPMTPKAIADLGFEQVYKNAPQKITMRDGKQLSSYVYENESEVTIILLHGILSSSYLMNKTAGLLKEATNSEVIALDFRGHGQSEGKSGDVDYINQYVDDLEDVILNIKKDHLNQIDQLEIRRNQNFKLRSTLFNPNFGSVFSSRGQPSSFGWNVRRLSDLYTSKLSNLLNYPDDTRFYPKNLENMPHDVE